MTGNISLDGCSKTYRRSSPILHWDSHLQPVGGHLCPLSNKHGVKIGFQQWVEAKNQSKFYLPVFARLASQGVMDKQSGNLGGGMQNRSLARVG